MGERVKLVKSKSVGWGWTYFIEQKSAILDSYLITQVHKYPDDAFKLIGPQEPKKEDIIYVVDGSYFLERDLRRV